MAAEIIIIKSAAGYQPVVNVVYSKTAIPAGTEITEDMLTVKEINSGLVHKKSLGRIEEAAGKKALTDIEADEMLLSSRVKDGRMEQIKVINAGSRLFSVEFSAGQANGWWLKVGQYVDVIFVPDSRKGSSGDVEMEPNIVRMRHLRIAALIDEKGNLLKNEKRETLPKYISFEVDEKQDEFLAYAKTNGRLEISAEPE